MKKFKNPLANIQVIYRRSNPLTKVVVITTIVLCVAALVTLRWTQNDILAQIEDMRQEAAQLEQENAELEEKVDNIGSVQGVLDVAQEELGLVDPSSVIIQPED